MADFDDLWKSRSSVTDELKAQREEAEAAAPIEADSAIRIQRLFRGAFVREQLGVKRAACVNITRVFRGHLARKIFTARWDARADFENSARYHYHSIAIQCVFRGFYSRRYYSDHNARKKYIDSIRQKGDQLRETLAAHQENQYREEAERQQAKAQEEFDRVTQNLHHLVSTANIAGVYNSPYATEPVTVSGVPVEEHIRAGVKSLLQTRGYTKRGLVVDANGSRKIPVRPPKSRLSIQASSAYAAVEEEQRMMAKLNKMTFSGNTDFTAGGKARDAPYRRGLNEGSQYFDPWRNPYLVRGVPKSQKELEQGRTTLGKAPPVPFHVSVGGNKSAVLANGIFDVIAEAEEAGGVCQRHRSNTVRWGVPDTCDVRDEVDMFPPIVVTPQTGGGTTPIDAELSEYGLSR